MTMTTDAIDSRERARIMSQIHAKQQATNLVLLLQDLLVGPAGDYIDRTPINAVLTVGDWLIKTQMDLFDQLDAHDRAYAESTLSILKHSRS